MKDFELGDREMSLVEGVMVVSLGEVVVRG